MERPVYKILLILLLVLSISLTGCNLFNDVEDETSSNEEVQTENEIDKEAEDEEQIREKIEEKNEEIKNNKDITKEVEEQQNNDAPVSNISNNSIDSKPAAVETPTTTTQPQSNDNVNEAPSTEKEGHTLKIEGKVQNNVTFTLDELKEMSDIIYESSYYSLNNFGTTRHDTFKGVNLWGLLNQKAQIQSDASKVTILAVDGYSMEFTVDQVKKQDYIDETNPDAKFPMIIAWEENGVEYSSDDGPPFKLIVGQTEAGDTNKPQWVSNIDKIIVE